MEHKQQDPEPIPCPICQGAGCGLETCTLCFGSGKTLGVPGWICLGRVKKRCPACRGTGALEEDEPHSPRPGSPEDAGHDPTPQETESMSALPPAERTPGAEILVVDDDPMSREVLIDILEDEGYQVAAVANGREALEGLQRGLRPCVILLDLVMPVMDAAAFRQQQLQNPALAAIPVIVMTGASDSPQQAFAVAAPHYFLKPYDIHELLDTIARYCRSSGGASTGPPP
jgi:CheY-like chemotaxis protein